MITTSSEGPSLPIMKEIASVDKPLSQGGVFPKERRQAAWRRNWSCSGLGEEGMASAVGSKKGLLGKGWLLAVGHALEKDGMCAREPTELLVRSNAVKAWLGGVELCGKAACGRGRDGSGRPGTACGERGSPTGTVAAWKAMWRAVF